VKRTTVLGALLVLAACGDAPREQGAAAPDTARLRAQAESAAAAAAARDSATLANEKAALMPMEQGWTAAPSAVQLSAGTLVTLRSVRETAHEGFDRIVFDFGERSMPNYEVRYVDAPLHQCGSGEEVRLQGQAWLAIRVQPVDAHDDAGNATVAERNRQPGLPNLLELRLTCDFEAQVEWIAGVARKNGYRVSMLQQPTRLVVDIRH
jgi:hypothetical protein